MNSTYVVTVRNLSENTVREVRVEGADPMQVHKQVFMKTSKDEEIQDMLDADGNLVFNIKKGFKKAY